MNEPWVPEPRKIPPKSSWWATPEAKQSDAEFAKAAELERNRITGNQRFGGAKKIHDSGLSVKARIK